MRCLLVNKRFGLSPRTPLFPNASQKDNGTRTGEQRPLKYFHHIRDCTSLEFCDSDFLLIHFNRQEILYQYYAYAFHGSAVSMLVASGHLEAAREKKLFRDRYWGHTGQLLANFFALPLEREVPEVFAKVNSAQFPSRF